MNDSAKVYNWLVYGKPTSYSMSTPEHLIKKWNLKIVRVAGCRVNEMLRDSVQKENAKVNSIMRLRFGEDWIERYYTEVREENYNLK